MGGIPCDIIVMCGALKSSAAELYEYPYKLLKPIAKNIFNFESELCDNAERLSAELTDGQKLKVKEEAETSWKFANEELEKFLDDHADDLVNVPVGDAQQKAEYIVKFRARLREFLATQKTFFHDLVLTYS